MQPSQGRPLRGSQLPHRGSQGGVGSGTPNYNLHVCGIWRICASFVRVLETDVLFASSRCIQNHFVFFLQKHPSQGEVFQIIPWLWCIISYLSHHFPCAVCTSSFHKFAAKLSFSFPFLSIFPFNFQKMNFCKLAKEVGNWHSAFFALKKFMLYYIMCPVSFF